MGYNEERATIARRFLEEAKAQLVGHSSDLRYHNLEHWVLTGEKLYRPLFSMVIVDRSKKRVLELGGDVVIKLGFFGPEIEQDRPGWGIKSEFNTFGSVPIDALGSTDHAMAIVGVRRPVHTRNEQPGLELVFVYEGDADEIEFPNGTWISFDEAVTPQRHPFSVLVVRNAFSIPVVELADGEAGVTVGGLMDARVETSPGSGSN